MSNMEKAKADAEAKAKIDFEKGLQPKPTRHNAWNGSAWATWYLIEFRRLQNEKYKNQFDNILKRFA